MAFATIAAPSIGSTAIAHHSAARAYDNTRTIEARGVITKVLFKNPHSVLHFDEIVGGKKIEWVVEMGPAVHLTRTGWTAERLQPGTTIKVSGQPSRIQGLHAMCCAKITRPDGTPL
jgi:hypothetical protein